MQFPFIIRALFYILVYISHPIFKVFIPGNLISKKWIAIYFSFFTLQRIVSKCQKTQNPSLAKRYLAAVPILEGSKREIKHVNEVMLFSARRTKLSDAVFYVFWVSAATSVTTIPQPYTLNSPIQTSWAWQNRNIWASTRGTPGQTLYSLLLAAISSIRYAYQTSERK